MLSIVFKLIIKISLISTLQGPSFLEDIFLLRNLKGSLSRNQMFISDIVSLGSGAEYPVSAAGSYLVLSPGLKTLHLAGIALMQAD